MELHAHAKRDRGAHLGAFIDHLDAPASSRLQIAKLLEASLHDVIQGIALPKRRARTAER